MREKIEITTKKEFNIPRPINFLIPVDGSKSVDIGYLTPEQIRAVYDAVFESILRNYEKRKSLLEDR